MEVHSLIFLSLSAENLAEQPQDERQLHVGRCPSGQLGEYLPRSLSGRLSRNSFLTA